MKRLTGTFFSILFLSQNYYNILSLFSYPYPFNSRELFIFVPYFLSLLYQHIILPLVFVEEEVLPYRVAVLYLKVHIHVFLENRKHLSRIAEVYRGGN